MLLTRGRIRKCGKERRLELFFMMRNIANPEKFIKKKCTTQTLTRPHWVKKQNITNTPRGPQCTSSFITPKCLEITTIMIISIFTFLLFFTFFLPNYSFLKIQLMPVFELLCKQNHRVKYFSCLELF